MTLEKSVSARDDGSPAHSASGVSRRNVLVNTLVSVASVASASAVAAPSIVTGLPGATDIPAVGIDHPDAELIALARNALDLEQQYLEASAREDELRGLYYAMRPQPPSDLAWRPGDPVEYVRARGGFWCNEEKIEGLRNKPQTRREFIGTDAEWDALPSNRPPPPGMMHLFANVPDTGRQKRADEIVAAYDFYMKEDSEAKSKIGLDVAEARLKSIAKLNLEATRQVCERQAVTLDGMRAKARVMLQYCYGGALTPEAGDPDECLVASLIRDLTGAPLSPIYRDDPAEA